HPREQQLQLREGQARRARAHQLDGRGDAVPRVRPRAARPVLQRDVPQPLGHWLPTPQVLNRFALHYKTGKPIPQALVKKIEKASTFNQGFSTVEYLASALVDMKLHLAGEQTI